MNTQPLFRTIAAGALALACCAAQAADFKFGVNAPRGPLEAKKWEALVAEIGKSMGKSLELVPLSPNDIDDALGTGKVDFALANPVSAVIMEEKYKGKPLATLKQNGTPHFAGVIFAKKGSSIQSVNDLKGKNVMAYQFGTSAGAYVFQVYYVKSKGLDPAKDFASFKEAKKQDDIVLGVMNGFIDAGFVRSGMLESMEKEGKIKLSDFEIIDAKKDDLNLVHSTPLYPEWILVAHPKVDADTNSKMKAAVLAVKASDPGAQTAKVDGFVDLISLDGLKKALKTLKVEPYTGG